MLLVHTTATHESCILLLLLQRIIKPLHIDLILTKVRNLLLQPAWPYLFPLLIQGLNQQGVERELYMKINLKLPSWKRRSSNMRALLKKEMSFQEEVS
jgi:hypothetical protein